MTNKEILQADLLDILFENRNKAYGAYALRKNYNHRLQWAVGIALGFVLILSTIDVTSNNPRKVVGKEVPGITLTAIEAPKPKIPDPPHPPLHSQSAQIRSTQIAIVPDERVIKPEVPTVNDLTTALTSTITQDGVSPNGRSGELSTSNENQNDVDTKTNKQPEFHPTNSDAQFPGGKEAFAKFLRKYLNTPGELEAGDKKTVLVRFMVDPDGAISKTEILQSDGEDYSKEVIRVLAKMPKWIPALQNGTRVATWFTQPVTFIGVE